MKAWLATFAVTCSACGAAQPVPQRATVSSSSATTIAPAVTAVRSASPGDPQRDPRVEAIVARVDSARLRADVAFVSGERNAVAAPAHLAEVADYVASELAAVGMRVSRQPVEHRGARADNIIGERAGADSGRVVVIAAHYDSVAGTPGADDDASAVGAVLAVARLLAPMRTAATLRVIAFAFEEDGLVGSRAYVASLSLEEAQRIAIVLSLDMVGYRATGAGSQRYPAGVETLVALAAHQRPPDRGDFIAWLGLDDLAPSDRAALHDASAYVPALPVFRLVVPRAVAAQIPDLVRGDHAAFWQAGLRAVGLTDTGDFRNPGYHLPADTLETLDFAFLADVTRWLAAATALLAGLEG